MAEKSGLDHNPNVTEVKASDILIEDFEATPRPLGRGVDLFLSAAMIILSLFQLYTSWLGTFQDPVQRGIHLAFVLPAAFIMYPLFKMRDRSHAIPVPWYDVIICVLTATASLWVVYSCDRIQMTPGMSVPIDMVLAPIMILGILEATRRIMGPVLPSLVLLLIAYAFLGPYLPGLWQHRGFSLGMVLQSLYLEPDGIFGYIVGISASIIAGFLIFGVILSETGGGETFVDLAKKIAGRSIGGPAKVSIFSSAFFGTISGSAVANVVVDGVFNIPLMKSLGYKKEFAAAVEATTSTGGQLVPPVMGAGAFIMAEILGVPYAKIAWAAVIPSFLYYSGCFFGIHFWAQKMHLKSLPPEMIPSFRKQILPRSPAFVIPVASLVYFLSIGRNPALSVFYSVMLSFATYVILPHPQHNFTLRLKNIVKSLDHGGRAIVMVACLCACAQMVVGLMTTTGLGIKISETVVSLAGNNIMLGLFFTMIVALILGMGVPSTAAYVLAASVCIPPLTALGIEPLIAHMFVFYFAIVSVITPPVCAAVYVAAAIARSDWLKTGVLATKLGLAGFIVPYMFYFTPTILLQGDIRWIIQNSVTALLGIVCLAAAVVGYLKKDLSIFERVAIAIAAFMFIDPGMVTDIIGFIILGYIYFSQRAGFSLLKRLTRKTDTPTPRLDE